MSDLATAPRRLLSFEFVGLCSVSFLAFCNVTVFYDLFGYLASLGIPAELRGLVIGSYSLTAMALYLVASPLLTFANAPRTMFLGIAVLAASGIAYLHVHSFWGLLSLRMLNGAGQFCVGAGAMALLVAVIPPERSGQAFGIYSVAILVAYALVPAVMDAFAPLVRSPPQGYAAATLSLLPAAWIVWRIRHRLGGDPGSPPARARRPGWTEIRADLARPVVALLLLLNVVYFANWSSVFFLFKGFAEREGIANVGAFFTVQMGFMIAIRLGAGRLFDALDKAWLVGASFAAIAVGHLALDRLPGVWAVPFLGALFGIGLGAGYPSLNGLMFEISPPRSRALAANLMLFAVQAGFFLGPVLGGALVARRGYHGYFTASVAMALAAVAASPALAQRPRRRLDA